MSARIIKAAVTPVIVIAGLIGSASAADAAPAAAASLTAKVTLSPTSTIIDRSVKASISHSTLPSGDSLKSITLTWGDRTKAVSLTSLGSAPKHRYLRPGKFTVKVTLTDIHGVSSSATATEVVRAPGGSYSGPSLTNTYGNFGFYVSGDGTQIQDVYVPAVALTCSPGGATMGSEIVVNETGLKTNGTFAYSGSTTGAVSVSGVNYPATYAVVFDGHFTGLNSSGVIALAGTLSETVTYSDSTARKCTSGTQTWTATRDSQPTQPTTRPAGGSYSGPYLTNTYSNFRFFVPSNRTQLQDVYVPSVTLRCTPGSTVTSTPIVIDSITLPSNGYFATTVIRTGDYGGNVATFSYSFRGHVHGLDSTGTPRLAGSLLVTMTYTDSVARTCTSNTQPWYASRDSQPTQTTGAPPAGSYSGPYLTNTYGNLGFFVSADQTKLQDLYVPGLELTCSPGGAQFASRLLLNDVTLNSDGSFSADVQETGAHNGYATTFTYILHGHVQGLNASGTPRLAGSLLETATFTGSTAESCTSNVQPWYATRDAQPTQTTAAPPAGSYTGPYLTNTYGTFSFQVSSNQTELQDISVPSVSMDCVPGNATASTTIVIPTATINSDGSFDGEATVDGTYDTVPATWHYSFTGQFQSVGSDGNERAAGVLTATLTYTNGTSYSCTSNMQAWRAELG